MFLTILAIGISVFAISCSNSSSPPYNNSTIDTLYTEVNTETDTYIPSKTDAYKVAKTIIDAAIFPYVEDGLCHHPIVGDSVHYMNGLTTTQVDKNTFTLHGALQPFFWDYSRRGIFCNGYFFAISNFDITVTYIGKNKTLDKNMWIKNRLKFDFYPTPKQKREKQTVGLWVLIFFFAMVALLCLPFLSFILHRE